MTERDRPGGYNPFEDTGDWPFRESAPPPVQRSEPDRPFDREQLELDREQHQLAPDPEPEAEPPTEPPFQLDERRPEAVLELEPEREPEPEPEIEPEPDPDPAAAAQ